MADIRVAVIVACSALAACARAQAAPGGDALGDFAVPAGWQELPAVAMSTKIVLGTDVAVDHASAWGDPARGCYAVRLAVRSDGAASELAADVLAGFAAAAMPGEPAWIVRDVVAPAGDTGVLALQFERGDYRGRLRARLGGGQIAALACFANARERVACDAACAGVLGAIP